jgi:hypothetical protein
LKYTTAYPDPCPLPYGCFDLEEGYYDPKEQAVFSYQSGDKIRNVESEEEREWIVSNCREGINLDEGVRTGDQKEE